MALLPQTILQAFALFIRFIFFCEELFFIISLFYYFQLSFLHAGRSFSCWDGDQGKDQGRFCSEFSENLKTSDLLPIIWKISFNPIKEEKNKRHGKKYFISNSRVSRYYVVLEFLFWIVSLHSFNSSCTLKLH